MIFNIIIVSGMVTMQPRSICTIDFHLLFIEVITLFTKTGPNQGDLQEVTALVVSRLLARFG